MEIYSAGPLVACWAVDLVGSRERQSAEKRAERRERGLAGSTVVHWAVWTGSLSGSGKADWTGGPRAVASAVWTVPTRVF